MESVPQMRDGFHVLTTEAVSPLPLIEISLKPIKLLPPVLG